MSELRDYVASLPRKRMAVGVILRDSQDRILLVHPTYRDGWQLPGGVVESDESPASSAAREVAEELGLEITIGRHLLLRWLPPSTDDPDGVIVIDYDGGQLADAHIGSIVLPPDELDDHRFVPVHEVAALTSTGTTSRIMAAMEALKQESTLELEGDKIRPVSTSTC